MSTTPSKRGTARIRVLPLHGIHFRMTQPQARDLAIMNVSIGGVGLLADLTADWCAPGSHISGHLVVADRSAPLELEVRHVTGAIAGCQIRVPTDVLRNLIHSYLDVEHAASQLREANPRILKAEPVGTPRWFMGQNNCEFFVVVDGENLVRFEISIFGTHITGAPGQPLRFGYVVGEESGGAMKYKGSLVVKGVKTIPEEMLKVVIRFLENVPRLSPVLRSKVLKQVQDGLKVLGAG